MTLVSLMLTHATSAASIETIPENLIIKPVKNYSAIIKNPASKEVVGHLDFSDSNDQVNYVYTDANSQQKFTLTLEQHFGEAGAFLFQIFDDKQMLIGKLAISNPANIFFKGFELYDLNVDIKQILNHQANPVIFESGEIISNNFIVRNTDKKILATISGRATRINISLNQDNLAHESFITNNPDNINLLLAIFAMQSLKFIQQTI